VEPGPPELPQWVKDLDGEISGAHLAIRPVLPKKKSGRVSRKQAFLGAYVQCASVTRAAQAAGVCREMHYEWLETDAGYAQAFEATRDQAAQVLEDEAVRRAYQGTLKPVYYTGQLCGVQREYSDGMLTMLLKGARPEKYRDRVDHTVVKKDLRFRGSMTELLAMYREMTQGDKA
jgi:hypothetical protein